MDRGEARIFPWGGPKLSVLRISVNVIRESTHSPPDESSQGGVGTFPNYLNGYVPPNRVVILERFRLLRNSVCRVGSQPVFYCGTSRLNLKIAGLSLGPRRSLFLSSERDVHVRAWERRPEGESK